MTIYLGALLPMRSRGVWIGLAVTPLNPNLCTLHQVGFAFAVDVTTNAVSSYLAF